MSSNIQTYSLLSWLLVVSSVLTCGKSLGHPRRASASAFLACCASTCTLLCFVTTRQLGSDRVQTIEHRTSLLVELLVLVVLGQSLLSFH